MTTLLAREPRSFLASRIFIRLLPPLGVCAALLLSPPPSRAATFFWGVTPGPAAWNVDGNWSPLFIGQPAAGGDVKFTNGGIAELSTVTPGLSTIQFEASGGTLRVLSGGDLNTGTGILGLNSGETGTVEVSGTGRWDNGGVLTVGAAGTGTLKIETGGVVQAASVILGSSATGSGTLDLIGTSGSRGVLETGFLTQGSGAGKINFDGGILRATATETNFLRNLDNADVEFKAGGANIDSNGFNIGIATVLGGTGGLTKLGAGTLTLTAENNYIGGTTINGGLLEVNGGIIYHPSAALQVANLTGGTGAMVVSNAGTVTGSGSSQIASPLGSTGSVTVTGLNSVWVVTGNLLVGNFGNSNGTLTIDNSGLVTLNAGTGTLTLAQNTFGPALSQGTLNIGTGGAAGFLQAAVVTGGLGTAVVNFNHTGSHTFAPQLTGSLSVNKLAAGTTIFTGANSYTGGTTLTSGILRQGAAGAFSGNSAYTVNGGTLDLNGFGLNMTALSGTGGTVSLGSAGLTVNQAGDTTFAGAITGNQAFLVKSGAGILTLTGTGSMTGNAASVKVNVGTLRLASGGSFASEANFSIGDDVGTNGTLVITGTGSSLALTDLTANAVFLDVGLDGTGTFQVLDGGTFSLDGTVFNGGGSVGLGVGPGGSSGTVLVSGAGSTFTVVTNPLTTSSGLVIGVRGNGDFTVADGGEVSVNQRTVLASSSSGITGTLNLNGTLGRRSVFATTFIREGSGTGSINFNGGILRPLGDEANFLQEFEAGDVTLGAGGAFIDTDGFAIGIATPLGGPGSLNKQGAGTLTLTGTHTYAGGTTVNGGSLIVNGSITGPTTIFAGTLGGTGTTGAVTVNSTGTIAPGKSIGTLHTGTLTLNGTAIFALEINTSTLDTDLLNVNGDLLFNLADSAQLSLTDLGADVALPLDTTFAFIDYSGAWNGGTFAGHPDDSTFAFGANTYQISYNGLSGTDTAVTLTTVVPEPGTAVSLLAGLGVLLGCRRRR